MTKPVLRQARTRLDDGTTCELYHTRLYGDKDRGPLTERLPRA
jgi:hypothetical protein